MPLKVMERFVWYDNFKDFGEMDDLRSFSLYFMGKYDHEVFLEWGLYPQATRILDKV